MKKRSLAITVLFTYFLSNAVFADWQRVSGNIDGDNAAAMRYTEAKLTSVAESILKDIEYDTVNFKKTYDGELEEPEILPSQFPNILANGSSGIAVGMATNIPPHNITELCNGIKIINDKPNTKLNDLLKIIKGPDFPTGGVLNNNRKEIQRAYKTGKGFFEIRASYKIEELGRGLYQIVVTQIPYQVNKSKLIEKIASLILEKKNKLLDNIIDESDEKIRIILRPKNRNVDPHILMESLFNLGRKVGRRTLLFCCFRWIWSRVFRRIDQNMPKYEGPEPPKERLCGSSGDVETA